jgi:hypothetical protein
VEAYIFNIFSTWNGIEFFTFNILIHMSWAALRQCLHDSKYSWMECHSPAFETYLANMPPFDRCKLQLPAQMRIFTFGSSYMRQLAVQLLCAEPGMRYFDGDASAATVVMPSNATLTNVANNAEFQDGRGGQQRLAAHLVRERYDVAFFMIPHPPCFFRYRRAKELGWSNYSQYQCIDLSTMKEKKGWDKVCANRAAEDRNATCLQLDDSAPSAFLTTLRQHVPHVYEVAPWVPTGPSPQQLAARNDSDHSTILPWAVWKYPCQCNNPRDLLHVPKAAPDCRPLAAGHQCAPGALSLMAAALAARAWRHSRFPSQRCAQRQTNPNPEKIGGD